ncbi:MAG: hypothetical protein A3K10_03290 [Bacteroidetes bacterium RIFCSPLOWO2_12_FULL_31_6]|nr:MAG: hypothetical protein A3K10_03290 [Bacteroidetes bacterium RIFCSPLOWO2_12_FULL_31_6]
MKHHILLVCLASFDIQYFYNLYNNIVFFNPLGVIIFNNKFCQFECPAVLRDVSKTEKFLLKIVLDTFFVKFILSSSKDFITQKNSN